MATFKVCVQKQRKDGFWPVYIRVIHHNIMEHGINKGNRLYVHLSRTSETAVNVGKRHGKPVVLVIDAKQMAEDGHKFYLSRNGVWLTDYVDVMYITTS